MLPTTAPDIIKARRQPCFFSLLLLALILGISPPMLMAQLKPKEKGNCFIWNRCRGDSVGNAIIESAASCATLGGKSWMREDGLCVSFPGGPQAYNPNNYKLNSGGEPWPGRR